MTPSTPVFAAPRRLSPRAALMVGLAGILVAIAVIITASRSSESQAPAMPPVHNSATPSQTPTSEAGASDAGARAQHPGR